MEKSKVYFCEKITPENVLKMYEVLGKKLTGNVAVKVHSGEAGNQNFLKPEFFKEIIDKVGGTVVECNTAYDGERNTTEKHKELIKKHGWEKLYSVDIMDENDNDLILDIPNYKTINKNYLGSGIQKYDSMLVLSHFKGHPMGGFGGSLKQLSIGCASSRGKAYIHTAGRTMDLTKLWEVADDQNGFLSSMADAASSVVNYFSGNMAFINVMANMSVDCDCCAVAEDPCMKDIGILSSLDPVALDKACIDLVYNSKDEGRDHLVERIESRNGTYVIECAENLGIGTTDYELIKVD